MSTLLMGRDGSGFAVRSVFTAPSRPYRAPDSALINPGLRKALPRARFSRPVGASILFTRPYAIFLPHLWGFNPVLLSWMESGL